MSMEKVPDRFELDSRLSELSRVWVWAEAFAVDHGLAEKTRFAMHLCIEEALANVVLHGYRNEPGHRIGIQPSVSGGWLFLAIEDEAPPFAPAQSNGPRPGGPTDLETLEPGGNGILLMRRFAGSVNYEPLPHGNRLTLGFPLAPADASRDSSIPLPAESQVSHQVSENE